MFSRQHQILLTHFLWLEIQIGLGLLTYPLEDKVDSNTVFWGLNIFIYGSHAILYWYIVPKIYPKEILEFPKNRILGAFFVVTTAIILAFPAKILTACLIILGISPVLCPAAVLFWWIGYLIEDVAGTRSIRNNTSRYSSDYRAKHYIENKSLGNIKTKPISSTTAPKQAPPNRPYTAWGTTTTRKRFWLYEDDPILIREKLREALKEWSEADIFRFSGRDLQRFTHLLAILGKEPLPTILSHWNPKYAYVGTYAIEAMGKSSIPWLLEIIEKPDLVYRLNAIDALGVLYAHTKPLLIELLNHTDLSVRMRAIEVLGKSKDQAIYPILEAQIQSVDAQIHLTTLRVLHQINLRRFAPILDSTIKDTDFAVQAETIKQLGECFRQINYPIDVLLEAIPNLSEPLRRQAIKVLWTNDPTVYQTQLLPFLLNIAQDSDDSAQIEANIAIARCEPDYLPFVEKLLFGSFQERGTILQYLAEVSAYPRHIEALLVRLLRDDDLYIRADALVCLKQSDNLVVIAECLLAIQNEEEKEAYLDFRQAHYFRKELSNKWLQEVDILALSEEKPDEENTALTALSIEALVNLFNEAQFESQPGIAAILLQRLESAQAWLEGIQTLKTSSSYDRASGLLFRSANPRIVAFYRKYLVPLGPGQLAPNRIDTYEFTLHTLQVLGDRASIQLGLRNLLSPSKLLRAVTLFTLLEEPDPILLKEVWYSLAMTEALIENRKRLFDVLKKFDNFIIPYLIELVDSSAEWSEQALQLLAQYPGNRSHIEHFAKHKVSIQSFAVHLLAEIQGQTATPFFLRRVEVISSPTRRIIFDYLKKWRDPSILPDMVALFDEPEIALDAIDVLTQIGTPEALQIVLDGFRDSHSQIYPLLQEPKLAKHLIEMLKKIGNQEAIDILLHQFKQDNSKLHPLYAHALVDFGQPIVDQLIQSLGHPNTEVQYYAVWALKRLGGIPIYASDFKTQLMVIKAFKAIQDPRNVPILIDLLNERQPFSATNTRSIADYALEALEQFDDSQAKLAVRKYRREMLPKDPKRLP